jgi:hypothetical protein
MVFQKEVRSMSNLIINVDARGAMTLCEGHNCDINFFISEIVGCRNPELLVPLMDGFFGAVQKKVCSAFFMAATACNLPVLRVFAFFRYQISLTDDVHVILATLRGMREIAGHVDAEMHEKPDEVKKMRKIFVEVLSAV